ncbi:MAG TPA: ABC transporter permease [Microbacterium sp.]|nr:ABC transporter permease [Microbacterium sp.]
MDILEPLLASGIRFAIPLLIAALGELVSQRAGVTNIGTEGYMAAGAFTGFAVMLAGGGAPGALVVAAVAGILCASIMAIAAVWLGANQILVGFALFVLLPNLAGFLYLQLGITGTVAPFVPLPLPVLSSIPIAGPTLFTQSILFYAAILAAILLAQFFTRTRSGLALVAVGHDPAVAASRGIRVKSVQTAAVLFGGLMSGLGGAALAIGSVGSYSPGLIDGRGLIVIAIVILGRWTVTGVVVGATLIGVLDAAQLVFSDTTAIPIQLFAALPWVIVLVALLISVRLRSHQPRSL